ncbi:hypothetical protein PPL_02980 [Heterostelium album PN500]|uniref:S-adenosyl-L-methionine-dependent methyltransferase n=1 Tax=Heterostelium pallidum (strain ATCC 26659 / Pp 5 / PN500) TaxID=670386 RepID=D3B3L2_HETP5|nr:hypothetical protein PPL_02980 [Heterostelium album PN500]EFA83910.1 hypothetical protein PPL_02980 [Heterostelium album PN500]|eukprot:XP_020436027.1 hypothetical protein PPL_02980 [Heterostelium album PN500]
MKTNKTTIISGVPRTSIMVAAVRTLITNFFIKEQLEKEQRLEAHLLPYYENIYKKENVVAKTKLSVYDPYAFFFSSTEESKTIILNSLDKIAESCPKVFETQMFKDHFSDCGLPEDLTVDGMINIIKDSSPLKAWSLVSFNNFNNHMALRTKFIDDYVLSNIDKYQQFVILGAGLDTRALRMPFSNSTTVWEIDFPETFEYKETILKEAVKIIPPISQARNIHISGNLIGNNEWITKLEESGFNKNKPTLWILEGLLMYISNEDIEILMNQISSISPTDSTLLIQTLSGDYKDRSKAQTLLSSSVRDSFKSSSNNPEQYLIKCGFTKEIKTFDEHDIEKLYLSPQSTDVVCKAFSQLTNGYK